jgi:hypothetical protein
MHSQQYRGEYTLQTDLFHLLVWNLKGDILGISEILMLFTIIYFFNQLKQRLARLQCILLF